MQTSLLAHAAGGNLTAAAAAAADVTVGAKQAGRGAVPVGPPIGCVRGALELEGPTAGCSVLIFVAPT